MNKRIYGNTYPVKDKLRAIGCRWDAAEKCWVASTDDMAAKANEIVRKQPALNSAPPQDLGPIDCAVEAAKHGREALADKTDPFLRSTSKGARSLAGETFWGKSKGIRNRYLIVRSGTPRYMSRNWLDDNDMFSLDPGYYATVEAVAVKPTAKEITNDPAVAKEKAKADQNRRTEIVRLVQQTPQAQDDRLQSHSLDGMVKCWGNSRLAGHEGLWSDGKTRLVYEQSNYDDGPSSWQLEEPNLAAEALLLKQ